METIHPEHWNNIPIPIQDAIMNMIKVFTALNKLCVHQDDYLTDLTTCLQNVFEFSEYSCEDMRERVQERIQMLNGKSEKETEKIE